MRIVRYAADGETRLGYIDGDAVIPVGPSSLHDVLALARNVNSNTGWLPDPVADAIALTDVRLLNPVPSPPSVRDFFGFEQHVRTARERRGQQVPPQWYEQPVFYFSNPNSLVDPDAVVSTPLRAHALDYELEVAAVVGSTARDIDYEDADGLIAGFTVMNDWSARDLQATEMSVGLGPAKGKDFATSLGPCLVTRDEFAPNGVREMPTATMTARVNGVEYSRGNLADCYWSFAEMLAFASETVTLQPGEIIGSGTVGTGCILELSLTHGGDTYPWLKAGDVIELEVERIGVLRNTVGAPAGRGFASDASRSRPS